MHLASQQAKFLSTMPKPARSSGNSGGMANGHDKRENGGSQLGRTNSGSGSSTHHAFIRPHLHGMYGVDGTFEKSGWLQKWTNYVKGYRRRWFVLDATGNLSYYSAKPFRNPTEVGKACHGSISLREAKIRLNAASNTLTISTPAQSFHLRAKDVIDRVEWFQALEFAHRSPLAQQNDHPSSDNSSSSNSVAGSEGIVIEKSKCKTPANLPRRALEEDGRDTTMKASGGVEHLCEMEDAFVKRISAVKSAYDCLVKDAVALKQMVKLAYEEHSEEWANGVSDKRKVGLELSRVASAGQHNSQRSKATSKLIYSVDDFLEAAKGLMDLAGSEMDALIRYASNEHEQKLRLQEQIETLARQHRQLEKSAFGKSKATDIDHPSYTKGEEDEEFHDAANDFGVPQLSLKENSAEWNNEENKLNAGQKPEEHVNVKRIPSNSAEAEESFKELFSAKVVTPSRERASSLERADKVPRMDEVFSAVENDDEECSEKQLLSADEAVRAKRRKSIPERPQVTLSLWSIMKNCIGKELTKIPMPVNFNEPLSVCQRISEDLEYAHLLLDKAAMCRDASEQMCYVAAYAVSCYSTTSNRTTKPFNPLLGETYECDRSSDLGWRSLSEQVSHHPPITALHAEGMRKNWTVFQDITMTSKFRGKYLSVTPGGNVHVIFGGKTKDSSGSESGGLPGHYTYKKITTTVHNIIVGKLWIDNHGEMRILNHTNGDRGMVRFHAYSYFSSEKPRRVSGMVRDASGNVRFLFNGYWDRFIDMLRVVNYEKGRDGVGGGVIETAPPQRIWSINPPFPNSERMYNFTRLAIEMNEEDERVAPTDSRRRPDQRLMEQGDWDEANRLKNVLEDKQRRVRREREREADEAMDRGLPYPEYQARWFSKEADTLTSSSTYKYKGGYWEAKEKAEWQECTEIFDVA